MPPNLDAAARASGGPLDANAQNATRSVAAIRGHPVHPMLVPLPIGAFALTFLTDALFLTKGEPFWAYASFWLLLAGIVSGTIAGGVGAIDYLSIRSARRPIGNLHALGNVGLLVLATVNYAGRFGSPVGALWPWGFLLTVLLVGGLAITGWAGGELTFRHRVGVLPDEPDR